MDINKIRILGRLGKDPVLRHTQQSVPVVSFRVATSQVWKAKDGEKKETTTWHDVVIWGRADDEGLTAIAMKLKKGSRVYIEGPLLKRDWEDKEGHKRTSAEIKLSGFGDELVLLDKQEGDRAPPPQSEDDYGTTKTRPASGAPSGGGGLDGDIPFAAEWR